MMGRPFCEVCGKYKEAKVILATAIAGNDHEISPSIDLLAMHWRMS
jgi:hypothetical protein